MFSILVLIGQRIMMMIKNLDQKYLKARAKQFDDQIDWQHSFNIQKQIIQQQQNQQKRIQQQRKKLEQQRRRQRQQQSRQNSQPPNQSNLRTSLVQNQNDRTDRKMMQDQQRPQRVSVQRRKSLTELRRSQQVLQNIRDEITSKQSDSSDDKKSQQRRVSSNNVKRQVKLTDQQNQLRNKTVNLQGSQMQNDQIKNNQQPSINPHQGQTQEDKLQRQYKDAQSIKYFIRIDAMFNQYIPILMSALVIGILCHSTYIFTMVCFFGYLFTSLLFNYANLLSKLKNQPTQSSIFSKINKLIAGIFILGLFAAYWFDNEF